MVVWIRKEETLKSSVVEIEGSTSFNGVPKEIIMDEILPRLPIKLLFRFKSVCKLWNNFITHHNLLLAQRHHSYNSKNLSSSTFFFNKSECVISSRDDHHHHFKLTNPKFVNRFCNIRGSINGLLYGYCYWGRDIFICNPITRHVVYVPNPKDLFYIALVVDTHNSPHFGFLIVAIDVNFKDSNCNWHNFEVYSSKAKEWRVSNADLQVPSQELLRSNNPIFVGRKVYWSLVKHLLWFDVEKDVAGLIRCPGIDNLVFHNPKEHITYMEFGVCNGDEISYSKMTQTGSIEVWLLKSRKGNREELKWVKRCSLSLHLIFRQNWNIVSKFCHMMRMRTARKVGKVLAKRRYVLPLPYQDGELVWFVMEFPTSEGRYGKLFSINMRTRELKLFDGSFFLPSFRFSASLLPCPT